MKLREVINVHWPSGVVLPFLFKKKRNNIRTSV